MKSLLIAIFVLTFCAAARAQTNEISPCPTVEVTGSTELISPGDFANFTVSVSGNYPVSAKYEWTISAGTIVEGQGSSVIRIVTAPEMADAEIIATVHLENLPGNCMKSFSGRATVGFVCGLPVIQDEYGKISFQEEKGRLWHIASKLKGEPTFAALFIIKFSKQEKSSAIKARAAIISKLLTEMFGIPKDRVLFVYGESEDQSTRIYFMPPNAIDSFPAGENSLEKLRP